MSSLPSWAWLPTRRGANPAQQAARGAFRSILPSHNDLLSGLLRSFLFTLAPDGFFARAFISSLTVLALVGAACLVFALRLEAVSGADAAPDCDFFPGLTRVLGDSLRLPCKPFRPVDTDES